MFSLSWPAVRSARPFFLYMDPLTNGRGSGSRLRIPPVAPPGCVGRPRLGAHTGSSSQGGVGQHHGPRHTAPGLPVTAGAPGNPTLKKHKRSFAECMIRVRPNINKSAGSLSAWNRQQQCIGGLGLCGNQFGYHHTQAGTHTPTHTNTNTLLPTLGHQRLPQRLQ